MLERCAAGSRMSLSRTRVASGTVLAAHGRIEANITLPARWI
jgi:hypothetical protein